MLYAIVAHTGYDMTQKARDFHARTALDWQEQGPAGGSNKQQQQQTGGMGVDQFLPSVSAYVRVKQSNGGI